MGNVNLELYRVFYVVANNQSITKAANELYISQPAVSQSIKQLENQIGGKLFVRNRKGIELTEEGKIIYEYIKEARELINLAEKKFTQLKKLSFGEIKIGASDTLTKYLLLKFIPKFINDHPDVSMKITNRTTQETIELLKSGKVDIGFINGPYDDDYLNIETCYEYEDIFVTSPNKKEYISNTYNIVDIKNLPLIMIENQSHSRRVLDKFFKNQGADLKTHMDLGSFDLVVDMVKVGLGVGCVPSFMVEKEIENGELVRIKLGFDMPKRAIQIAMLKNMPLNYLTSQFKKMVVRR